MTPQPITITFLSRSHEIQPYDSEGLEYRQDCGGGLELRIYRLNRGWMARLDVACFDTYTQSHRSETAQAAVDEIERELVPIAEALLPLINRKSVSLLEEVLGPLPVNEPTQEFKMDPELLKHLTSDDEPPSCDEPTVEMSEEMVREALQGG